MLLNHQVEIMDLSSQTSLGLKGPNAATWLARQGIEIPSKPNQWVNFDNNYMVLRLGLNEFVIQDISYTEKNAAQDFIHKIDQDLIKAMVDCAGVYRVPRADAFMLLSGSGIAPLLSQICRIDLGQVLKNNALVMTQMAGISTVVLKETDNSAVYRLWFDISYLAYMSETIACLAKTNIDFELV